MKAAVLSLACCCILNASSDLLLATPPNEIYRPVTNPAPPEKRTERIVAPPQATPQNPTPHKRTSLVEQLQAVLPTGPSLQGVERSNTKFGAVTSRQRTGHVSAASSESESQPRRLDNTPPFEVGEPALVQETIIRPWEVQDAPRPLKPSLQVHQAELAGRGHEQPASSDTGEYYSNRQRQASPALSSGISVPANPTSPSRSVSNRTLLGNEAEYRERDGFTYSVRTTNLGDEIRTARGTSTVRELAPRPLEGVKPAPAPADIKTRSATAPRPLKTSSNLRRTAPSQWFKPNPLRESSIAQNDLRSQAYVQQASAQSPATETSGAEELRFAQQTAPTEDIEQVPSIGDDQPLPFDLNALDKESAAPAQPAEKMPATEKGSEPIEENLSLDDLPFGEDEKKAPAEPPAENPTETKEPSLENLFPEPTEKQPAAEPPAKEESATTEPKEELPFPFDVPKEEKKPAETAPPMKEIPAEKTPAEQAPLDDLPFGETPAETIPQDAPIEQPVTSEGAVGDARSILEITTSIAPPSGELPADRSIGASDQTAIAYCSGQANRGWSISEYNWKPTGMFHQPLYFEEVNLERYGYSHGIAQPAISYGQFLVNIIAMPYKVMAEPPREDVYTLGHYRPGSYAPYRIHYPPKSISGGLFEAGVVVGLVFLIP